jgi:hypothetical protein
MLKIQSRKRTAVVEGIVWEEDGLGVDQGGVPNVVLELFCLSGTQAT